MDFAYIFRNCRGNTENDDSKVKIINLRRVCLRASSSLLSSSYVGYSSVYTGTK